MGGQRADYTTIDTGNTTQTFYYEYIQTYISLTV